MGILIFISAAIAIGVLIVILWSTNHELKEKSRRLQIAESKLVTVGGEAGAALSTVPPNESEKITDLERRFSSLTDERTQLLAETENLRGRLRSHGMSQISAEAEGGLVHLRNENAQLRGRIETLEKELREREAHGAPLKDEERKIAELEQQLLKRREEHAQFLSQIENLERERRASQGRIHELEEAQSKVSNLERDIAQLRGENTKLSTELTDFKSSLQEKLKSQINALQEFYRDVESRKE
jgi:chromosome segregation ATPase